MGVSGAAVWVFGCFYLPEIIFGQRRLDIPSLLEGLAIAAYGTVLTSWLSGGLGIAVGHFLPRLLTGRTAWVAFLMGAAVGAAVGLAADVVFTVLSMGWRSALTLHRWQQVTEPFLIIAATIIPTCAVWVGMWAVRWRVPLPHGFVAGHLYWDADCPFCIRWVGRLAFVARQGGFALVPLQSEEARRDLGLREGELPAEMKLRLADGRLLGGLDAFIAMAEAAGWTAPLGWFLRVPGVNALAWRGYRWVARNRHCLGGSCALPPREGRRA